MIQKLLQIAKQIVILPFEIIGDIGYMRMEKDKDLQEEIMRKYFGETFDSSDEER